LWLCQNPNDISYVIIKQRILDIFKQSWYTTINNSNRLSHYCLFKHEFETEKYLQLNMDTKYKTTITKFRLLTNNLAIETGRYNNTERQQRYCTQCNMNMIEDPYHFYLFVLNTVSFESKLSPRVFANGHLFKSSLL
jgi:hypothetical protein